MSIYHFTQPVAVNRFRRDTDRQSSVPGITMPSFICACCKKPRAVTGRRQVVKGTSKYGYKCRECQQ